MVSFDLFGTLVAVDRPSDPAAAVAEALRERGATVPVDFAEAYRERVVAAPPGAAVSLPDHVARVLRARGRPAPADVVRRAVGAAFDPAVRARPGASDAVSAAAASGPVACCSNCAVPGLVERTLARASLPDFDAVVTSVGCGWRKPDRRMFATVADRLDVTCRELVHVGDDPLTDGGVADCGGRFVDVGRVPLPALADRLADSDRTAGCPAEGTDEAEGTAPW